MSLLARLTWGKAADAVLGALDAHGCRGARVAVLGRPGLTRVLGEAGLRVAALGSDAAPPEEAAQRAELGAVVVPGPGERDQHAAQLDAWARTLAPGAVVVLVGRAEAEEASRRALCAGLVDLEQRAAGRWLVTSGRVPAFGR